MSIASRTAPRPITLRRRTAATAAGLAAVLLLVGAAIALLAPENLADHSRGAGRLSELVTGLAFLAGAVTLVLLAPDGAPRRPLWMLAPAGLAITGLSMLGVVVTGTEPPEWLFLLAVGTTLVGMVVAAVIGTRAGTWTWPVAVAVALYLPVMFLLPWNSVVMALIWLALALAALGRSGFAGRTAPAARAAR
jgi:hypothetical protein